MFPAPGATATLVPEEGETISVVAPAGASTVVVSDVPPGKYTLTATLARHDDLTMTVEIARGDPTVKVNLHPKPGNLLLVTATPRVAVRIQVFQPPEGQTAWQQALEPILVPVTLNFDPSLAGAKVHVTDDYGETVYDGSVPPGGTLTTKMRLGTHSMEVSHESFETDTFTIALETGENVPFDRLRLRPKSGSLKLSGPAGAVVFVNRGGSNVATETVGEDGRLEVARLAPGRYEVEMKLPGGGSKSGSADVRAAEASEVEWQE